MIPNNIILTWKDYNLPEYIIQNIKILNPDKSILFFTDKDIVSFLKREYDSSYVDFFNSLELGCTKGDFFRYCYLFKYGGYYCDIDIKHQVPIYQYINKNIEFFSVISALTYMNHENSIFQALLYCNPENPIIYNCITEIMGYKAKQHKFYHTTEDMYTNICAYLNEDKLYPNNYITKSGKFLSLGKEAFTSSGFACYYNDDIIALSRYPNYTREKGFIEI